MIDLELVKTWEACNKPNWDGYGAFPVKAATLQKALVFVQVLPAGAHPSSVSAEPDGYISLDWYQHPYWAFSVSISPEGNLFYAGLFGNADPRGQALFLGDVPTTVLDLIAIANAPPQCPC